MGLENIPKDTEDNSARAQPSPRATPQPDHVPIPSTNPELNSGVVHPGSSAAGVSNPPPAGPTSSSGGVGAPQDDADAPEPPLQFIIHDADGTLYRVDSREDDTLYRDLEANMHQLGRLVAMSVLLT